MDLETIIPLVIVAVAYLFKTFENARKGDKKKRPSAPGRPLPPGKQAVPAKTLASGRSQETPRPGNRETPAPQAIPAGEQQPEGQWWEEIISPPPAADKREHSPKTAHPQKTGQSPDWRSRKKISRDKLPSGGIPPRPVADLHDDPSNEYADFDLEDAVIKAVILERREF